MIAKFKRVIFGIIYKLLRFQNYIPSTSSVSMHPTAKVYGSRLDGDISIEQGVTIARAELYGTIRIGRYTSINGPNTDFYANHGMIKIGNFCSIARSVGVQVANHKMSGLTTYPILKNVFGADSEVEEISKGDIVIEHDVWIGTQVTILPGAYIHTGAVIAANSVVNSEIPPYAVAGGTPAKVLKYRFDPEVIDKIMALKWWDWDLEKIRVNRHIFSEQISVDLLDKIDR